MLFEIASVIYGIVWTANAAVLSFADVYEPEQRKASLVLIIQCIVMPHSLLAFYIISRLEDYITYCATAALTFAAHIVYAVFITIAFYDIITAADIAVCLPASILVWFYGIVAQLYLAFAGAACKYFAVSTNIFIPIIITPAIQVRAQKTYEKKYITRADARRFAIMTHIITVVING